MQDEDNKKHESPMNVEMRKFRFIRNRQVMTVSQIEAAKTHFASLPKEDMSAYDVVGRIDDLSKYLLPDGDLDEIAMLSHHTYLNTGSINPRPDEESFLDKKTVKIRYKYEGPLSSNSRSFCIYMIDNYSRDYFRREDINQMSFSSANNDFGTYSIWNYKGSFNCKHAWVAYIFRLRSGEDVSDASSVTEDMAKSSTVNARVK